MAPAVAGLIGLSTAIAADLNGIRGPTVLTVNPAPPPFASEDIEPDRLARSAYDQPPVIPHSIRDYRIDARANQCLSCHGRTGKADVSAPTISIAHFRDRDGRILAAIAPGHYFCTGCHVPQAKASPPVANTYQVLATVPFRRYLCMECHLPQTGTSAIERRPVARRQ
ncbi:MAG TPA: nitrate reductase cytochrome c-type subunit [Stellaceae bacterium]|nr:nitrate reductase cytochrome c-type subunit [Stellaceae bacterium]